MRDLIRKIILVTAEVNREGRVWGKDTDLGDIEEVVDLILMIIQGVITKEVFHKDA